MATNYNNKIVTDNLVFCIDAADKKSYSGSGSSIYNRSTVGDTGTIYGSSFSSSDPKSFAFDGTDDYFVFDDNDNYTFSDAVSTWEAWCKPTGNAGVLEHTIMTKADYGQSTREYQFQVRYSGGTYYFYLGQQNNNSGWKPIGSTSTSNISINQWYHILVTSDGSGNAYMYINGDLATTATGWWTGQANLGAPLCVGATINGGTNPIQEFVGNIAVCRLYKKFFNSDNVLQNFNAQRGRFGI